MKNDDVARSLAVLRGSMPQLENAGRSGISRMGSWRKIERFTILAVLSPKAFGSLSSKKPKAIRAIGQKIAFSPN